MQAHRDDDEPLGRAVQGFLGHQCASLADEMGTGNRRALLLVVLRRGTTAGPISRSCTWRRGGGRFAGQIPAELKRRDEPRERADEPARAGGHGLPSESGSDQRSLDVWPTMTSGSAVRTTPATP